MKPRDARPTFSKTPDSPEAARLRRDLFSPRSPWRAPRREAVHRWLGKPRNGARLAEGRRLPAWAANLVGVALAERRVQGRHCGEAALTLLVQHKLPKAKLTRRETLPRTIDGFPTDVVAIGSPRFAQDHTVPAASAVGLPWRSPGTLGAYLRDPAGRRYALTAGHVIDAVVGTPAFSPSYADPGAIELGVVWRVEAPRAGQWNTVDLGLIALNPTTHIDPAIPGIGAPSGSTPPDPTQAVRMLGIGAPGLRTAWLHSTNTDVSIPVGSASYPFREVFYFWRRGAGSFGHLGDSGALLVDDNSQAAIAQLFAVAPECAFAIPMGRLTARLTAALPGWTFL